MDRSLMGKGDCFLIPQGEEQDTIRQFLEREVEEKEKEKKKLEEKCS